MIRWHSLYLIPQLVQLGIHDSRFASDVIGVLLKELVNVDSRCERKTGWRMRALS